MSARALYLELAARGVCIRTGAVPDSMPPDEAGELLGRVKANRLGLREVLAGEAGRDPDLEALRGEARAFTARKRSPRTGWRTLWPRRTGGAKDDEQRQPRHAEDRPRGS